MNTSKLDELVRFNQKKGNPPTLKIIVKVKNKILLNKHYGRPAKNFDVGSMTKIMVTTPLCMMLVKEKKLNLNSSVGDYLPIFADSQIGKIKLRKLLSHSSGLEAWRPFYKTLLKVPQPERKNLLKKIFRKVPVKNARHCTYSDLNFILLGWIIEEVLDMTLDEAAQLYVFEPIKMSQSFFNPKGHTKNLKAYAPTEKTRARGLVKGFVFDDNCDSLGGVAGHAGVFSTAEDIVKMGDFYLRLYNKNAPMFRKFVKRAVPKRMGDWGLGFTLPSKPVSSAGTLVSSKAFGHVGYPGTSLWIDPSRQAVVTVLSNRTYPNHRNEKVWFLRREIHDRLWEIIDDASK